MVLLKGVPLGYLSLTSNHQKGNLPIIAVMAY
jgi:hypothetical protein